MKTKTIRDVAKEAGVSPSTVSRVLTKSAFVAEDKEKRVLEAIKKLGFKPNTVARSLRLKNSRIIGLLIPDITNPFFPEVAKGVEDAAHTNGYNVMLCNTENDVEKELAYVELLKGRQTDGLIVAKAGDEIDHLKKAVFSGMPITFIDRPVELSDCNSVLSNNSYGMELAVEALYGKGHTKIGFVAGPFGVPVANSRWLGFRNAMQKFNLPLNSKWVFSEQFSVFGGRSAAKRLLELSEHPTAMVCSSDVLAIGLIDGLGEARYNVPQYMSVIGFDDIGFTNYLNPKLTTIKQAKYEMGQKAFELLLCRINNQNSPTAKIILDVELIERDTHSKPR